MKDSEFIELLNLYLDHEISAADAVRLEAEVQNNPARRRIYQDYCRMQKACKVLAQDFQTETPGVADKKVVPFRPETAAGASRSNAFYTIGAVAAAAACLAIIFVGRSRQQQQAIEAQGATIAAKTAPADASQLAAPAAETRNAPIAIDTPEAKARMGSGIVAASTLRQNEPVQATFVSANALFLGQGNLGNAAANAQQVSDQFGWLRTPLGLVSLEQQLQLEKMRFETASMTLQPTTGQRLGSRAVTNRNQPPAAEMNAFQFTLGK